MLVPASSYGGDMLYFNSLIAAMIYWENISAYGISLLPTQGKPYPRCQCEFTACLFHPLQRLLLEGYLDWQKLLYWHED